MRVTSALKPAALVLAAALTVSAGTATQAYAAPLTAAKVSKIVKKQIAKAAPTLSVARATTADRATTATTAGSATRATTADNATALGGRSLAQLQPVLASAQENTTIASIGAGSTVVSLPYTLAAPSHVGFVASVELEGDDTTADQAACSMLNDGVGFGLSFETKFASSGSAAFNPATVSVVASLPNVAPGTHTVTVRCRALTGGPVFKDDASLNLVAVPN